MVIRAQGFSKFFENHMRTAFNDNQIRRYPELIVQNQVSLGTNLIVSVIILGYTWIYLVDPRWSRAILWIASIWVWVNTYRYIFSGMNIHKSQLFWGSLGTRVLTHTHIIPYSYTQIFDLQVAHPNRCAKLGVFFARAAVRTTLGSKFALERTWSACEPQRERDHYNHWHVHGVTSFWCFVSTCS